MDKHKIIIQAFGLSHVKILAYSGAIGALEAFSNFSKGNSNDYNGLLPDGGEPNIANDTSVLGTPVFDNLIIASGNYIDTTYGLTTYNQIRLDACLITLYQQNNVVLTPIQGKDGEVIEYISKMSFRINVKGGIFGVGNKRPFADIANFKLAIQTNDILKVIPVNNTSGGFLNEWDISQFAILDKNFPQLAGGYNCQLFEFNAIQDVPVILAQSNA